MKLPSYKKVQLLTSSQTPTARRTRSQDSNNEDEDTIFANAFHLDSRPKDIPLEVTPGKNKMYTKAVAAPYHEFFLDSIDVICQVFENEDWLPKLSDSKRSKGVFIPLKHFKHESIPPVVTSFSLSYFKNKGKGSISTKHFKFGISYYPSCIGCEMNVVLEDFFKKIS